MRMARAAVGGVTVMLIAGCGAADRPEPVVQAVVDTVGGVEHLVFPAPDVDLRHGGRDR